MNNLKITREQKVKLLAMCNTLFPEHKWTSGGFHLYAYVPGQGFPNVVVHWFEFCMTYLQNKLYKERFKAEKTLAVDTWNNALVGALYFCFNHSQTKKHPVDYLYEEFEKLTPNINEQQGNSSEEEVY